MPLLVREAHHLVLDRRAVARPAALDGSRVHRRAAYIRANHIMRARVRVCEMTRHLRLRDLFGAKRKRRRRLVTGLHFEARVVDGSRIKTWAGPGLQAPDAKAELAQMIAQAHRGEVTGAACRVMLLADMHEALQKSAGGENHRARFEDLADLRLDSANHSIFDYQALDARLANLQVRRHFEDALHPRAIRGLVRLSAARANRGTLARIEEAELDSGLVNREAHLAAECVDLAHQVALADSADGRVTRHLPDMVQVEGEHQRLGAHPRGRERGFDSGVSGPDYYDVVSHSYFL